MASIGWHLTNLWDGRFIGLNPIQSPVDMYVWEWFFNEHPIKSFIELGTYTGATSLFFYLNSINHGFSFDTFEINPDVIVDNPVANLVGLRDHIHIMDIFANDHAVVKELILKSEHPIMLFCDNGHKPTEMGTFCKYLSSGDYAAVHDWGTEFLAKDIPVAFVEEYYVEESESVKSSSRWFRRK